MKKLDLDESRVRDLYVNQKKSLKEIAEVFGVSKRTILERLKDMGVKRRDDTKRKNLDLNKIKDLYINQGKSVTEIGKIFGVSPPTLSDHSIQAVIDNTLSSKIIGFPL